MSPRRPADADDAGDGAGARSAVDALADARDHARRAVAEALRAVRALAEAAALATAEQRGEPGPGVARLLGLLEAAAATLEGGAGASPAELLEAIAEALDAEIARWEERAAEDPDARAVLRAFLGLRELLWEVGVRPRRRAAASERGRAGRRGGGPGRVQHVPVEG